MSNSIEINNLTPIAGSVDIEVNGNPEGTVFANSTLNVQVTDGTNPVAPDSVTLVGNDLTLELNLQDTTDFIMLVKTDNAGTSASNQFTIPTTGTGFSYTVETSEQLLTGQTGSTTLTWAVAGTYEVRVRGIFLRIVFNNTGDRLKLLEVRNQGYVGWGDNNLLAYIGCINLNTFKFNLDFMANTTNAQNMLTQCGAFAIDPRLKMPELTNGNSMFNGSGVTGNLPNLELKKLTDGFRMFRFTAITGAPILDLRALTNGGEMFQGVTLPTVDYSNILIRMEANNPNNNVTFHGGNSKYNVAGGVARAALVARGWIITDGGPE
jgi:hypothetical protein